MIMVRLVILMFLMAPSVMLAKNRFMDWYLKTATLFPPNV